MQRGVALLLATVLVLASLAQVFLNLFVLTFCDENCERDDAVSGVSLALRMVPAAVVLVISLTFWVFVAFSKPTWATRTFVTQLAVALLLLIYWLDVSSHSDDKLLGVAAGAEMCAFLALLICRAESRERQLAKQGTVTP
jgi:hypothetical protein